MLPYVIHDIVRNGREAHIEVVSRHFAQFFAKHCALAGTQSLRGECD